MNDNSPLIVTLPSNRHWRKAERVIEDVAPTKFLSEATPTRQQQQYSQNDDSGASCSSSTPLHQRSSNSNSGPCGDKQLFGGSILCLVCRKNQARYTCPKCQTPYCSIECYRNHPTATSYATPNESTGNESYPHPCSEDFFKRKVTSLMQLESLDQEEKAYRALNRYHTENSGREDFQDYLEGDNDEIETLYDLKSQLEILENRNEELSHKELAKLLPPSLKSMFEKDLQTGQLQADWILNRWYPWWKRELVTNGKESESEGINDDTNNENCNDSSSTSSKILDERLLRVPIYEHGKNGNDDVLLCNLIDILYATCRTLRLYHGVENASRQAPVEAATTLISTSSVLGKDRRFTTIYQVLNHHCNSKTEPFSSSAKNTVNGRVLYSDTSGDWSVCIDDIASLITSPRMVGRALLEASDILKAAIKMLKLDQANSKCNEKESNSDCEMDLKQMRRLRKKLQFFLSWATRHPVAVNLLLGGGPKEEVLTWIDERKEIFSNYECGVDNRSSSITLDGCLESDKKNTMESSKVQSSGSISLRKLCHSDFAHNGFDGDSRSGFQVQEPLLVEVQSRHRSTK